MKNKANLVEKIYRKINNNLKGNLNIIFFMYLKYIKGYDINIPKKITLIGFPIITMERGSKIRIGENCVLISKKYFNPLGLKSKTIIRTLASESTITIGNRVGMSGCVICSMKYIEIGSDVGFGANTTLIDNDFHPTNPNIDKIKWDNVELIKKDDIIIKDNVMTGMEVLILKGVVIESGCFIGARSIIYKNIQMNSLTLNSSLKIIENYNNI